MTADDLVEYGMIPEFVGRLPVVTPLEPLSIEALIDILTKPKNAVVRQYKKLFELENADIEFTENALEAIAQMAKERDTGARALRSMIEDLMLDVMFDLPEKGANQKYIIDRDIVLRKKPLFPTPKRERRLRLSPDRSKSRRRRRVEDARRRRVVSCWQWHCTSAR